MIAYLLLILLVAILAYFDARREDGMIDARPGGPDLDHKELVWRRLRNVGALVMVAVVCDGTEGWDALWMGLCHAGAAWAMFTGTHRLSLNLMRGMDWRYIAPWGNKYDRLWWRIGGETAIQSLIGIEAVEAPYRNNSKHWRKYVHRAGTLAYCFETAILAASIVGVVAILNH